MKVSSFTKVTKGDAPKVPDEIWVALNPLMSQVERLTWAVQGRLDLETNGNHEIRTIEFSDDTEQRITLQRLSGNPLGVILLWEELYDYTQLTWKLIDEKTIKVKIDWTSNPSTPTKARIMILGGA